jgi:hypothetical protein
MNTVIKCIHCGRDIEISEAIRHEVEEQLKATLSKDIEEKIKNQAKQEFEEKQKEIKSLLEEANKRVLESEKKAKETEEKIREQTAREAAEKHRLEKLEYEKKFADMQKALEEAQRKGKQGSQQLQGEVLELDLEEQLRNSFQLDEFLPVPKGIEGGDIWQKVKNKLGKEVGSILWETKRTKNWDKKWLVKLRDDTRKINASDSILVSQVLPEEVKSFHNINKVWVTNFEFALHVARIVRYLLLKIDSVKSSATHEEKELRDIFQYITSDAFRHKIEAHEEAVQTMKQDLDSEIRLTQIRWKKRQMQLNKLDSSVTELYGELQGIIPTLPDINVGLLPDPDEAENDN